MDDMIWNIKMLSIHPRSTHEEIKRINFEHFTLAVLYIIITVSIKDYWHHQVNADNLDNFHDLFGIAMFQNRPNTSLTKEGTALKITGSCDD